MAVRCKSFLSIAVSLNCLNVKSSTLCSFDSTNATFSSKPETPSLSIKAAKIQKGSAEPNKDKVGTVTRAQLIEIAEAKMVDLNCYDAEAGAKIIEGTARSMGLNVEG